MKKIFAFKISIMAMIFLLEGCTAFAQKDSSVTLTYSEGKNRLLKQSLVVLAEYYNISIAEAELQQARLWNNPYFVWNADMYSIEQNKYFNFANQKLIQVEYVFSVSGKRINAIRQANLGVEIAQMAFADVVRGLILEFSQSFTSLQTLIEKQKIYESVISQYDALLRLFEKQLDLGVASANDLVRIRSEYISVQNELMQNQNDILAEQSNLNTLLNFSSGTKIVPVERPISEKDSLNVEMLLNMAYATRPDFLLANKNIQYYQADLRAQKSESVPDIKLAYQPHDKGSNYVRPYTGMVFEMSIPVFNRNQGGISKTNIKIEQSKLQMDMMKIQLENEVMSSFLQYRNLKENYKLYTPEFLNQVRELSTNANVNFERKNISLLQYIDYQRAYIDIQMQYMDLINSYLQSVNVLNFSVGKEITN